jgi:hypothetical protein
MPEQTPELVQTARDNLAAASADVVVKMYEFESARDELRETKRKTADYTGAEEQVADLEVLYRQARALESDLIGTLHAEIQNWLPAPTPGSPASAAEDVGRLEAAPIFLFPCRVETRFDGGFLKVRVFPDEVSIMTHEEPLTPAEDAAGRKYWQELMYGAIPQTVLWRDLIARFGVPRAAWILDYLNPGEGTELPETQLRSSTWTRPGTAILPDRWVVYVYKGGTRRGPYYGGPIVEPLQVTPDPKMTPNELVDFAGGKMDPRLEWTLNFSADSAFRNALESGMGILVPLEGDDGTTGFDRVVVLGVKSSLAPNKVASHLNRLFESHHYTSTFAIVPQGAPTNNVEGQPTAYPLVENAGERSFVIERAPLPSPHSRSDGIEFTRLFGTFSGLTRSVDGKNGLSVENGRAMNTALWPATLGYFLEHMFDSVLDGQTIFTKEQIALARVYFQKYVLARGPIPAFRVGAIPYGVLPIAALGPWQRRQVTTPPDAERDALDLFELDLLDPLQRVFALWKEATPDVHRIRADQVNPDVDVARVLSTHPSAKEFWLRRGVGTEVQGLFFQFLGIDLSSYLTGLDQQGTDSFAFLGHSEWRPRLGRILFDPVALIYTGDVVAPTLSEVAPLSPNFIDGIRLAPTVGDVNTGNISGAPSGENLLYKVLRHSTLAEYLRSYGTTVTLPPDYEIFNIPSSAAPPATLTPLLGLTPGNTPSPVQLPGTQAHLDALAHLSALPTAELHRLFGETLDLTSHRLDAWITALATRRLNVFRRAGSQRSFLGGFSWVEDVRPRTLATVPVPGLGDVPRQAGSGGFIHAPSMTQASAAAVLRSGHLSAKVENGSASAGTYAVDLSSERVRMGRRLFEGVRSGQPLGALLGYEFERGLHEGHPGVTGLDAIRFAFRKLYPLVANASGQDGTEPVESIAARNVVDGVTLLTKKNQIPWNTAGLPAQGTNQYNAVQQEIARLSAMYDATADLLTADGVYQLVRGNVDAAAPTLNNLVTGGQPPDTVISRSPRGGIGIAHRVALVFPSDDPPELEAGLWPSAPTPRADAEPVLNAWIGELIGDPTTITAKLTYLDAEGNVIQSTPSAGTPQDFVTVALSDLGMHPLDVLAMAQAIAKSNQGSILDRRIIRAAMKDPERDPDETPARFQLEYQVAGGRSFPAMIEVLNTASGVLGASRPLSIADLLPPAEIDEGTEEETATTAAKNDAKAFYARAVATASELINTHLVLVAAIGFGSGIADSMASAARFLPLSAFPDPLGDNTTLVTAGKAVVDELKRKVDALPTEIADPDAAAYEVLIADATNIFKTAFGENFLALPPVHPPRSDEISLSLGARSTLLAGQDEAPDRYVHQAMRARDRLGRLRKLSLYARTAGLPRPRVDVVQLPHAPGERWLGLPFDDPETPPEEGRAALLLLNYAEELHADVAWSGLLIDDWTEIIPNRSEDTGIALNYEAPRSKAPQTVLVAVPSSAGDNWVWEDLIQSVEQALDLAKIRCVDRDLIGLGQLIPGAVFATNEDVANTVSTAVAAAAQAALDILGLDDA